MIKCIINQTDKRYIFIAGDRQDIKSIESHLNKIPQYMFLPSFSGIPKPIVFLDKFKSADGRVIHFIHSGLYLELIEFCEKEGITIEGIDRNVFRHKVQHTYEEFKDIVSSWNLSIAPYEYQLESVYNILQYDLSLSQLATRAGKTLMAYMVFRYMIEYRNAKNILMVVPSIQLVKQGYEDFKEYAEFFKTETVWAKGEMCQGSNMTIGTYQSLVKRVDPKSKKYDPKFFDKFDVVCIDETHQAKAESIKQILNHKFMKFVKIRFGFSGTLPLPNTIDSYEVQMFLGGMIQDIRSKELMDGGYIAPIVVEQHRIVYPVFENSNALMDVYIECAEYLCANYVKDAKGNKILRDKEDRKMTMVHKKELPYIIKSLKSKIETKEQKQQYLDYLINLCKASGSNLLTLENMVAHQSVKKQTIIHNMLSNRTNNIICFYHYVEYGKSLYNNIKAKFPDRNVYFISGTINSKKRDAIKNELLKYNNCILVASYGCTSTGLTFKNLKHGFFVESFKSHIINKQSLGRGLSLQEGKDCFELNDIIDCLPTKKIYLQGVQKAKLYKQEEYDFSIKYIK